MGTELERFVAEPMEPQGGKMGVKVIWWLKVRIAGFQPKCH